MPRPAAPIRLHGFALSGHSHRVELLLSLLDLPYDAIQIDLPAGAHKRPEFLALNPFGQVPVIEDGATVISDSNAILVYLAARYGDGAWLPRDADGAAQVQRWLSVAAGEIAHGPAAARLVTLFGAALDLPSLQARAVTLFAILEAQLDRREFLVGTAPTIADVALYSYIALAPEGGVSLDPYPALRAWLARVEALPRFLPMPRSAVGLAA